MGSYTQEMIYCICMLKQTSIHFVSNSTQNCKKLKKKIYYSDFLLSITPTSCLIMRHLASFKLILEPTYEFYIKNYVSFDFKRRFLPQQNMLLQGYQRSQLKIHEKNERVNHDILFCGAVEVTFFAESFPAFRRHIPIILRRFQRPALLKYLYDFI